MARMKAKYSGTCRACGDSFGAGADIIYTRSAPKGRKTIHATCFCSLTGNRCHRSAKLPVPPVRSATCRLVAAQRWAQVSAGSADT